MVDWHWIWSTNFGDPLRVDKRSPGVSDRQIQMNPQAAMDLGLEDGDYVYVDANPADRPYRGWKPGDAAYHAYRCMVRVKFNGALPYTFTILKHTGWIATPRTVKAHESRADGRALAQDTGYQASYRYGSHQSITRNWLMPMHQTDGLFHKKAGAMGLRLRLRRRQPRGQHRAEGDPDQDHQGRAGRPRWAGACGRPAHGLHTRARERRPSKAYLARRADRRSRKASSWTHTGSP